MRRRSTPLPPIWWSRDLGRFDEALAGKRIVGRVEDGRFAPYPDRGAIEDGLLAGRDLELLWIDDPVDVFLLQVQGSGRVVLPDGEVVRVGFAAHNGRPYRSIGRVLIERGELQPHAASWEGIRGWIEANPDEAAALFAENPRFVFFRLLDGEDGPIGAQGVALTAERSLAVDRRYIPLGAPLWLDATMPGGDQTPLRRLMVAQDAGGAINGPVRGDFFWGYGDAALAMAGKMKSRGRYFLLLPTTAADRMMAAAAAAPSLSPLILRDFMVRRRDDSLRVGADSIGNHYTFLF
jgi:membrane-bound lytic murein transglycosylase A